MSRPVMFGHSSGYVSANSSRRLDEVRGEGAHDLVHRVLRVDAGDAGAGHVAVHGAGRRPCRMRPASTRPMTRLVAPRWVRPWVSWRTSMTSWTVTGVGERGGGELHDVRLVAPRLVLGGLLAACRGVAELGGRVPDDADDPARPAALVAADVALGVGPARGAVPAADAEVRAVVLAAVLQGLADQRVQAGGLGGRYPHGERGGVPVVLVGAHVEDLVGLGVHVHQTGVQVPVEAAHAVERQDRIRVGGPVVRE